MDLEPVTYSDNQYGNNLILDRLRKQRASGKFCDVLLIVKATGRQYAAHRNVLAACSPYFDTILRSNKVVKEHVTITSQNAAAFELLLEYMYSGSVVLDRSNVIELLKLANNFLILKLKGYCAEYLDRHLDSTNCLTIQEMAERYNLPGLLKASTAYLQANINHCLIESNDAHTYPIYKVEHIFTEYRHSIRQPIALNFVLRWCAHNPVERQEHFQNFLSTVIEKRVIRISDISNEQLSQMVDASLFLRSNNEAMLCMLQTMLDYGITMPNHLLDKYNQLINHQQNGGSMADVNAFVDDQQQPGSVMITAVTTEEAPTDMDASNTIDGGISMEDTGIPIVMPVVKQESADPEDGDYGNDRQVDVQEYLVEDNTGDMDPNNQGDGGDQHDTSGGAGGVGGSSDTAATKSHMPRASLKLTLKLPSMNKKARLMASQNNARHNVYRRKVTTANNLLRAKGRPPKFRHRAAVNSDAELAESDLSDWDDEMPVEQIIQTDMETAGADAPPTQIVYKCPHCVYTGPDKNRMRTHISRAHRANRIYVCTLCEFECKWNREYYLHMKQHFQGPPFNCDMCDYNSDRIQQMLTHRMKHTDEKPFKCTECEYRCRTKTNLAVHQRQHSGEKPFSCGECGRGFAIKSTLDQHLATHSDTRPFQCEKCSFSTKYQSHLISHKRIHTGDVFHCTYTDCTYSSPKKSQLAAHLRTHLAVRAHTCKQCNRSFIEKSHLVRHERIHLAEKPFKCDNCEYASSRRDKLKEHILKHHGAQSTLRQKQRKYRRQRQLAGLVAKAGGPLGLAQSVLINNTFRPITPATADVGATNGPTAGGKAPHAAGAIGQHDHQHHEHPVHQRVVNQNQHNLFTTPSPHPSSSHRPSSAVVPPTGYGGTHHHHNAQPSPALSLNFNLGGFESPVVSGKKDVLLSTQVAPTPTQDVTLMTPTPRIGSPSGQSQHSDRMMAQASTPSADLQRPMSLPPFGGQQVPPSNPASVPGWNQQSDFSFTAMF